MLQSLKKIWTTFNMGPTICVSSTNEKKTQVGWVVAIRWIVQKWIRANNIPPNGSLCHILNFNEMIMKCPCQVTWKKYSGDGHA
jgi:hypothetical protein